MRNKNTVQDTVEDVLYFCHLSKGQMPKPTSDVPTVTKTP